MNIKEKQEHDSNDQYYKFSSLCLLLVLGRAAEVLAFIFSH